jgi:hypothetical protein
VGEVPGEARKGEDGGWGAVQKGFTPSRQDTKGAVLAFTSTLGEVEIAPAISGGGLRQGRGFTQRHKAKGRRNGSRTLPSSSPRFSVGEVPGEARKGEDGGWGAARKGFTPSRQDTKGAAFRFHLHLGGGRNRASDFGWGAAESKQFHAKAYSEGKVRLASALFPHRPFRHGSPPRRPSSVQKQVLRSLCVLPPFFSSMRCDQLEVSV